MPTDFLFTRQSFIRGMGSLGNLNGSVLFNASDSEAEADEKAICSDWQAVGADIRGALQQYAESL